MSAPAISVVVPTRDRPASLGRCLAALARQAPPGVEIVVVDDGSADAAAVRAVVARAAPGALLLRGSGEGPAAARNIGVGAATGAIVCFTDDDCAPHPHWAQRLAAVCGTSAAAAGTTRADPAAGSAAAAAQLITHVLTVTSLDRAGAELGFAPTCNLACGAALARRLPFDPSFPHAAGEDRDWCTRLAQAGVPLYFVADAIVVHRPLLTPRGLLRQGLRYGRGAVLYRTAGGSAQAAGDCAAVPHRTAGSSAAAAADCAAVPHRAAGGSVAAAGVRAGARPSLARGERRLAGAVFYRRLASEAARAGGRVAALALLAQAAVAAGVAQELAARVVRRR